MQPAPHASGSVLNANARLLSLVISVSIAFMTPMLPFNRPAIVRDTIACANELLKPNTVTAAAVPLTPTMIVTRRPARSDIQPHATELVNWATQKDADSMPACVPTVCERPRPTGAQVDVRARTRADAGLGSNDAPPPNTQSLVA